MTYYLKDGRYEKVDISTGKRERFTIKDGKVKDLREDNIQLKSLIKGSKK